MKSNNKTKPSSVFKAGAVSLAFLIIGYQIALFVHKAAVERIESHRDHPDTVYVIDPDVARALLEDNSGRTAGDRNGKTTDGPGGTGVSGRLDGTWGSGRSEGAWGSGRSEGPEASGESGGSEASCGSGALVIRKNAPHSPTVTSVREHNQETAKNRKTAKKHVENFRFDPNTVSIEDLQRLGFSEKQALSIDNYRAKGGRFRRKADFAKSFVVADSVFKRLEPFIDIPLVDINAADSAAFDALPGIGGWFASKMVSYREELGGYSCKEQLMDIWNFDEEKYNGLKDLICCQAPADSFRLWTLPVDELKKHPHIRSYQTARAIVLYRDNTPKDKWTVDGLVKAGILSEEKGIRLKRCAIARP